jgi:hypothetical protein
MAIKDSYAQKLQTIRQCFIIEQVPWNKSSLLPKNILQNTQTLKLFTRILKQKVFTKVNKMPSSVAWVQKPSGLIKMREEAQAL